MIVEFAVSLSLTFSQTAPIVTQVEFREPVREVVTYPPVGVLKQISGLPLPDSVQETYETEFLDGFAYFGAFAISKEFGYGYVSGSNTIEAAREIALQECYSQADRCMIYAEIYPVGDAPLEEGQVSLAPLPAGRFNNPSADWGQSRAMAISEDGAYAVAWNYPTQSAANAAALSDCEGYRLSDLPDLRDMPCLLIPFK